MKEKQVWVKGSEGWVKYGEQIPLWINALDSAYHRISDGYTVAVAYVGDSPEDGVQHDEVDRRVGWYWRGENPPSW